MNEGNTLVTPEKTNYFVSQYSIKEITITKALSMKHLGVNFDYRLKFNELINIIN